MTTAFTLKTVLNDDTRRVKVDPVSGFTFAALQDLLRTQFRKVAKKVSYIDDEGDKIIITSDAELQEAFRVAQENGWKSLKLVVGKTGKKEKDAPVAEKKKPAQQQPTPAALEEPQQQAKPAEEKEKAVHWGFECDASGMKPIVGARYHKRGENFDLCEAEFAKLTEAEKAAFEKVEEPTSWWGRFRRGHGGRRHGWRRHHGHHHHHHGRHGPWRGPPHGHPHPHPHPHPHHHHGPGGPPPPPPPPPFGCGFFGGGRRGPWPKKCFVGAKLKKLFWLLRNADLEPVLAALRAAQGAAAEACEPLQALADTIRDDPNVRALKRMARSPAAQKLKKKAHELHARVLSGELPCFAAPCALLDSDEWAVAVAQLRDVVPRAAGAVERLGGLAPRLATEIPALLPRLVPIVIGLFMTTPWKKPNKKWAKKWAKHQQKKKKGAGKEEQQAKLRAEFVKDVTVPDGTVVAPGAAFTKTWTVRNTGGTAEEGGAAWPEDTALLHVGGDMELRPAEARVPVGAVAPGDERQLSVELTAPAGDGRYWSYWRLVSGDGTAPLRFGPRLWADVSVKTPGRETDALLAAACAATATLADADDMAAAQNNSTAAATEQPEEPTAPEMLGTALTNQQEPTAPEEEAEAPEEEAEAEEPPAEEDVLGGRWEEAVAMLTAMGYNKANFQDSLVRNGGDVQAVLEELLG